MRLPRRKLAPFHFLASEGVRHSSKDHVWQMQTLARLCDAQPRLLQKTKYLIVDLKDSESVQLGIEWWNGLTDGQDTQQTRVGEGMVIKPLQWIVRGPKGLVQPAIKCRGKEYLRIIYGPEYDSPDHIRRLRSRALGPKRSLALREFSLGLETLNRFTRREPFQRVHECVLGVLALESEPVDPRL